MMFDSQENSVLEANSNASDSPNGLNFNPSLLPEINSATPLVINNEGENIENSISSFSNDTENNPLEISGITETEIGDNIDNLIGETSASFDDLIGKEFSLTDDLTGQEEGDLDDGNLTTAELDTSSIITNRRQPDLRVISQSAPTTASAGSTISVRSRVRNYGSGTAGSSTLRYYLSDDTKLDANDTLLGSDYVMPLSRRRSSYETASLRLSSNVSGRKYILWAADATGRVRESNETNNVAFRAINIIGTRPDLRVISQSAPTTASAGSTISVRSRVRNYGSGTAGSSTLRYYLSDDTKLDANDTLLGSDYVMPLSRRRSSYESETLKLGDNVSGQKYILWVADATGRVAESNETNNVAFRTINIIAPDSPDLTINNLSVPSSATAGGSLNVSYKINNIGNATAGINKTRFYLSKDKTLGAGDIDLGIDDVSSLGAGSSRTKSFATTLNSQLAAGDYYLIAKADTNNSVKESNESNNIFVSSSTIKIGGSGAGNNYSSTSGYGGVNAAAAVAKVLGQSTFADVPNVNDRNWGVDSIKAPEVWKKGYTGKGITVAVLDTGVDRNHVDLNDNIWKNTGEIAGNGIDDDGNGYVDDVYGWNFTNNTNNTLDIQGHGTHVAGTIAGERNNIGVTGIAYDAKIMAVKVLNDSGSGSWTSVANGIRYAVDNGAHVINMSLGGSRGSSFLEAAVKYASDKGVIVVSAAGNSRGSAPGYPGRYANKYGLVVGATDRNNNMAGFSNRAGSDSNMAYVTAPGVSVYSTIPNGRYGNKSGTSMAAPHVAGVIALMLDANENLTDAQVRSIVTSTSSNSVQGSGSSSYVGSSGVSGTGLSILSSTPVIDVTPDITPINVTPINQQSQGNGSSLPDDTSGNIPTVANNNSPATDNGPLDDEINYFNNNSSDSVSLFDDNSVTQTNASQSSGDTSTVDEGSTPDNSSRYGDSPRYDDGSGLDFLTGEVLEGIIENSLAA